MFKIKKTCYSATPGVNPYTDFVLKTFADRDDAEEALVQIVNKEVERLNRGEAEGEFIATFEDEQHSAVVNFWEGESCEADRDYRPVTEYDIVCDPRNFTYVATNILWDADEDEDISDLPTSVIIPEDVWAMGGDSIEDYLSNLTGFCHKGFTLAIKLWARVGVSMEIPADTYEQIAANSRETLIETLQGKHGTVLLDGETYFPTCDVNPRELWETDFDLNAPLH